MHCLVPRTVESILFWSSSAACIDQIPQEHSFVATSQPLDDSFGILWEGGGAEAGVRLKRPSGSLQIRNPAWAAVA